MRIIVMLILTIMGFSLFGQKSEEEKFWKWFEKNEQIFYHEIENLEVQESIFDDLSDHLSKIHPELAFEFSPIHETGIRELTISAEGVKEVFSVVEKLISRSPDMKNWQFNSFRQRINGDEFTIKFGEIQISYSDLFFRFTEEDNQLGIELNIRNFDNEGQAKNAIYILLDGLLGEYDVTMGINWIEWVKLDESKISDLNPITDLRTLIDRRKENE